MAECTCPNSTAISLTNVSCITNIAEIQKVIFRRTGQAALAATSLTTKAGIDALLAAADSTKLVITPFIYSNTIDAGEPIDDDKTLSGVPDRVGEAPSTFNGKFKLDVATYAKLKALECEGALEVILVPQKENTLIANLIAATPTYGGFKAFSLFTSSKMVKGHGTSDEHNVVFSLASDWFETAVFVTTTDYDPKWDLENA